MTNRTPFAYELAATASCAVLAAATLRAGWVLLAVGVLAVGAVGAWVVQLFRARPVRDERGAAPPLELALITVPVLAVIMFIVFVGRLVVADGTLDGVAHYGAREAARTRSAGDAGATASSAVDADLAAAGLPCEGTNVEVDTGNFRAGGTVAVRVTCEVRLSDLGPLPLPGTKTMESRAVATVDVFRGTR